jgi:glycosyltransferase involved in cell wall biosynthesis
MMGKDHQIFLYAPEGPDVEGAYLVECLTNGERVQIFGPDNEGRLKAWPTDKQTQLFNDRVVEALKQWASRSGFGWTHEMILLSGGRSHTPIRNALPQALFCEPFVGYEGILTPFCAFESYAWMHYLYGRYRVENIRWFDTVIYPYADVGEFPFVNQGNGEYLAFLGRRIERKGLHVAADIAKAMKMPLWVAGAGELTVDPATDVKYLGPLDIEERAEFLANARALLMPTIYCEPGGNVAIEAMMCGTPVICPDFGVMSETVKHGETGFHFRVLREAIAALQNIGILDPHRIRSYAHQHFSLHATKTKFEGWLERLQSLWAGGWYN